LAKSRSISTITAYEENIGVHSKNMAIITWSLFATMSSDEFKN